MRKTWIGTIGAVVVSLAGVFAAQTVWGQPEPRRPLGTPQETGFDRTAPPPALRTPDELVLPTAAPGTPISPVVFNGPSAETATVSHPEKAAAAPTPVAGEIRSSRQESAVSIEWLGPPVARLEHPMTCQLVVRNTSTVAVQNVLVRYRPAEGVQLRASEPPAASEGKELTWTLGVLAGGQTKKIELQMVSQTRGAVNCVATVTFTAGAQHQVLVREPLLAVKVRTPEKIVAGEPVTLQFAVSNPGDGPTEGIKLKAHLPEGLEHSRGRLLEVEVGTLAPKETRNLQLVCQARGSGMQKCLVTASAEGNLNARDTCDLEILLPKLDLAVTGPKLRYLDRHAVYVLKVNNPGTAPATAVALQEVIPAGFKFHSATAGGRYDEATRTVAWALGDVPPGQTREVAVDLVPTAPGEHRLIALVTSARGVKSGAEARTQVEGFPSLQIELADADDPVEVGAETAYELRITNTGTKTETNLEVTCTLPEQVEMRGIKCAADLRYRVEGREVVFEPLPRLAPRADVIYRLQVRGKKAGDARLRVRVRADDLREPIVREESTRFYSDDGR
jgi:uncharacterized repeat protein (TIGR01451 family)